MGDRIELRGLRVMAICGVLAEERSRPQPFAFDIDLECDLGPAGRTDDLADTIDYAEVCDRIVRVAVEGRYSLMERLAEVAAESILALDGVEGVSVLLTKLRPPVGHDLSTAGVRVYRGGGFAGEGP